MFLVFLVFYQLVKLFKHFMDFRFIAKLFAKRQLELRSAVADVRQFVRPLEVIIFCAC